MFKMVRWLLTLLCSCTMAVASNVSDDEVGRISQGIIDKYPNGWTCIRDMEQFYCELNWWCPEPEVFRSDSGNNLTEEQRKALARKVVNTVYGRTKEVLNGRNDNLLVSFLRIGEGPGEASEMFSQLLANYLKEHRIDDNGRNIFLRDALWNIQLDGMRHSTSENRHQNFSYGLIYECISLSAEDEKFIYDEIVEKMVKYGFGSMVPYRYRRE